MVATLAEPIVTAIEHVLEANAKLRKRRALARLERQLTAAVSRAFTAERRAFLSRFARLEPRFPPAVREVVTLADWLTLYDQVALETAGSFVDPLQAAAERALVAGMQAAVAELVTDERSFTLKHPRAVDYLRHHGAEQVTRIRETTRQGLRVVLTQAADEGWSYNKTAKAIAERYKHFSNERAKRIAVFETGDAYEHGNMLVARDLQRAGLTMEKSWLTVGDDRVRPDHQANQAEGWIPLDQTFSSGDERPPADPGCRCTLLMRRKQEAI